MPQLDTQLILIHLFQPLLTAITQIVQVPFKSLLQLALWQLHQLVT